MTNYTQDCKGKNSVGKDSSELFYLDTSNLQKALDDLEALKLLFSKNKRSKLSCEKSHLLSQKLKTLTAADDQLKLLFESSDSLKSKDLQESEKINVPNVSHASSEGGGEEEEENDDDEEEELSSEEVDYDDDESGNEEEEHYANEESNDEEEDDNEESNSEEQEEYGDGYNDEEEDEHEEDHHLAMDDSDGDEDVRAYFPCPFCYVEIEVHMFCSHLQDEHCFDLKNAVCPLCAANLGKDVIGHFIVQHASSLKRRRKSLKSGLWTGSSAMIGKELSSFLGSSTNGRANTNESAADPLLSPFLGSVSHSHTEGSQQDASSNKSAHSKSSEPYALDGGDKVDCEERKQRAVFVQQLVDSTIF